MRETRFRQAFLLLLLTAISAAFVAMIRAFLLTILLAAIFAGLSYPIYEWILGRVGGRKALGAIATLLLLLVLVIAPLLAVLGAGANEALRAGAIFWGTVMTVLSIIPGVGGALVSVPAAIIL